MSRCKEGFILFSADSDVGYYMPPLERGGPNPFDLHLPSAPSTSDAVDRKSIADVAPPDVPDAKFTSSGTVYEKEVPDRGDAWHPCLGPKGTIRAAPRSPIHDFPTAIIIYNNKAFWYMLRQSIREAIEYGYNLVSDRDCCSLSEREILNSLNSSGTILWERASAATYNTGFCGEKPFIIAYTTNATNSTVGYPMALVAFPGMDFTSPNDIINALNGIVHTELPGTNIRAHNGFVYSALSAEEKIFAFLNGLGVDISNTQVIFCGHSMGGAVASLCGVSHAHRMRDTKKRNSVVFTFGQPKTFSHGHAAQVDSILGSHNNLRFVTYGSYPYGTPSTTDSVTGFRNSKVDSFCFEHAGTEILVNSQKTLTLALGMERISLHNTHVYWEGLNRIDCQGAADSDKLHHPGSFTTCLPIRMSFTPEAQWSCCGAVFPHSLGCTEGLLSQHVESWDFVNKRWPCCQLEGVIGQRKTKGCSTAFADTVIAGIQAELKVAEDAHSSATSEFKKARDLLGKAQSTKQYKRIPTLFSKVYETEAVVKDTDIAVRKLRGKLEYALKNRPSKS